MSVLRFPTAQAMDRLEAIEAIKLLGTSADLQAALDGSPRAAPAVFVLTETTGGAIEFSGPPVQQTRNTALKLVCWVSNHGRPAQVRDDMDQLLGDIDARLAGWTPGDAFAELVMKAARDEFAHGAYLVAQAVYDCTWTFSAEHQA